VIRGIRELNNWRKKGRWSTMDAAQKEVRREEIRRELVPLRSRRDDNIIDRNRLNVQIDDLRIARNRLGDCISRMGDVARGVRDCHQVVPKHEFRGSRRVKIEDTLKQASDRVNSQRDRHMSNRDRLVKRLETLEEKREGLIGTIRTQNDQITALEAELRSLW